MRVVVAGRQGFRVQPKHRAELGAIDAGQDWSQRLARSLEPSFAPSGPAATVSLDIWVTPPDYTGLPPQFLPVGPAAPAAPAAPRTSRTARSS